MKKSTNWTEAEVEHLKETQSVGLSIDNIVKEHRMRFPKTPRTRRAILSKLHADGIKQPEQTKRSEQEVERIYRLKDAHERLEAIKVGDRVPVICPWEKTTGTGAVMKEMDVVSKFQMRSGQAFLMRHPVGGWKMTCTHREMLEAIFANI
jgi:hypothetical protein